MTTPAQPTPSLATMDWRTVEAQSLSGRALDIAAAMAEGYRVERQETPIWEEWWIIHAPTGLRVDQGPWRTADIAWGNCPWYQDSAGALADFTKRAVAHFRHIQLKSSDGKEFACWFSEDAPGGYGESQAVSTLRAYIAARQHEERTKQPPTAAVLIGPGDPLYGGEEGQA